MNIQKVSETIMAEIYANYSTTPYKLNDSLLFVDPTAGYIGKTADQINDFIIVSIFPESAARDILNAQASGRWIRGRVRVNTFDKQVTGDTAVNSVRTLQLLGIVDALFAEKTITSTTAKVTLEPIAAIGSVGVNEEYQRFESFGWWTFRAVFL